MPRTTGISRPPARASRTIASRRPSGARSTASAWLQRCRVQVITTTAHCVSQLLALFARTYSFDGRQCGRLAVGAGARPLVEQRVQLLHARRCVARAGTHGGGARGRSVGPRCPRVSKRARNTRARMGQCLCLGMRARWRARVRGFHALVYAQAHAPLVSSSSSKGTATSETGLCLSDARSSSSEARVGGPSRPPCTKTGRPTRVSVHCAHA